MKKPRLGFLGVGWIGNKRMAAVVEAGGAEIVGIADPSRENLRQASVFAPEAALLGTFAQLLQLDLDGIVIATPSALHASQSITALEKGVAVFCQKPLGRDAAEVASIIDAAQKADRLLGIDLSYRFTRGLRNIRDHIRKGKLGTIFHVNLTFHNAYGPQAAWFYNPDLSGGGCVMDLGIHLVDAALWTLETSVVAVSSRLYAKGQPISERSETVEDFATATLDLDTGAVVDLSCSWNLNAGCDAIIEATFHGTKGGATFRNVGGSFLNFQAEWFRGTSTQVLETPPDPWEGRAIVDWVRQLACSPQYRHEIEDQNAVAAVLDQIYATSPDYVQGGSR